MTDFRTPGEKKRGWWIESKAKVPCILPADGLLAVFLAKDIEAILDANYPHRGRGQNKRWYFNSTLDREIAELDFDRIACNPRVLWDHFL